MVSDVDEIPKSRFMRVLKSCEFPKNYPLTSLQCDFYYYSFEFLQPDSPFWPGTTIKRFSPNAVIPSDIRNLRSNQHAIPGVCFHCSYCFDSVASVRLKLSSYSHTELDTDKFRNQKHIIDRFLNGIDLFDRDVKPMKLNCLDYYKKKENQNVSCIC